MNRLTFVLAIFGLGLIAALFWPNCYGCGDHRKSRHARAKTELNNIENALIMYRLENRVYPSTEQGLEALVEKPDKEPIPPYWQEGGYLDRLPKDPWNREYVYSGPASNDRIELYSLGRDGLTGGKGENRDIIIKFEAEEFTEEQNAAWAKWARLQDDPAYLSEEEGAKPDQENARKKIQYLRDLVERYRIITRNYPTQSQGLQALSEEYLLSTEFEITKKEWLEDPWGREYLYRNPGVTGEAEVFSLGADGVNGGTEANQDLFSSSSEFSLELPLDIYPAYIASGAIHIAPGERGLFLYCRIDTINHHPEIRTAQASCSRVWQDFVQRGNWK